MAGASKLANNIAASWGANIVKALLQLLALPVMARFLGPAEMGLYALAMPVVSFVMPLADAGLANSLAREREDNHVVWSTAFWLLQCVGVVLLLGVSICAIFVGQAANQPRLPEIVFGLSLVFPLMALGIIPSASLMRQGRLVPASIIDMCANLVGTALGIYCAYLGMGVWAMVTQYVSMFFCRAFLFNVISFYRPRLVFSLKALGGHLQLGGASSAVRFIDFGGRIVENSRISQSLGNVVFGSYGFASQIAKFLSEAIGNAIWATLYYRSLHAEEEELPGILAKMSRILSLIILPASFLAAALAPTGLPLLLGEKWAGAGWPLAILCVSAPYMVLCGLTTAVLAARGFAKPLVVIAVISMGLRVIVIFCLSPFGVNEVCIGISVLGIVQFILTLDWTKGMIGHKVWTIVREVFWPSAAAVIASVFTFFWVTYQPGLISSIIGAIFFGIIYIIVILAFDRSRALAELRMLMSLFRVSSA